MKDISFSDAIRLGAAQGPQLFGEYLDGHGGSCAAGAAAIGAGAADFPWSRWRVLLDRVDCCPVCMCTTFTRGPVPGIGISQVIDVVIHLNNDHRWTREAIADWWDENYGEKPAEVRDFTVAER